MDFMGYSVFMLWAKRWRVGGGCWGERGLWDCLRLAESRVFDVVGGDNSLLLMVPVATINAHDLNNIGLIIDIRIIRYCNNN